MNRASFLLLVGLATAALPSSAQIVRGVVLEEVSATPVDGAMVILQAEDGRTVYRALTNAAGEFITDADAPGRYRIRVDRIGFASTTTELFPVPVGGTLRRVLVPIEPVELTGLDVEGSRRCRVRPEEGEATARVWEEVRKALEAAAWTLSSGQYRYTLLHFTRTLNAFADQVLDEDREFYEGRGQAPYVSLPAEDLSDRGFVRADDDGSTVYYAPDADALLSDAFLDTHCMRLRRGDEGMLGLEFEPLGGRDLPEISGVLWIEPGSATLRRLEFRYRNLPRRRFRTDHAGGRVSFARLPNGTWIVREWAIRMPVVLGRSITGVRPGYQEEGGVVWRVVDRTGTTVLEATTAGAAGSVTDSTETATLVGVSVRADSGEETTTDEDGAFFLPGLPEGLVRLSVSHPSLDTLGLAAPPHPVQAALGEIVEARLRLPGVGEVLAEACGGTPRPERSAIVLGRVRERGGGAAEGVSIVLTWLGTRPFRPVAWAVPPRSAGVERRLWSVTPRGGRTELHAELDERGIFLLCDVPAPGQVRAEVLRGGEPLGTRVITVVPGVRVATATLTIDTGTDP